MTYLKESEPQYGRTFSKLIEAQSFLAVGELDDVDNLPSNHRQVFASELLDDAVRIHHHGVQRSEGPIVLAHKTHTHVGSAERLRLEELSIRLLQEAAEPQISAVYPVDVVFLVFDGALNPNVVWNLLEHTSGSSLAPMTSSELPGSRPLTYDSFHIITSMTKSRT